MSAFIYNDKVRNLRLDLTFSFDGEKQAVVTRDNDALTSCNSDENEVNG